MQRYFLILLSITLFSMGRTSEAQITSKERSQQFSAIRNQDLSTVQSLVASGTVDLDPPTQANTINKALAYASIYGNLEIVEYILAQGVDIDGRISYGGTALLRASELEKNDIAEFLIRSGADVNIPNAFGISPMVGYGILCNPDLIDLALAHGGNIDQAHKVTVSTGYGELAHNPIQSAVYRGNLDCVKHLVMRGAATNVISQKNETLLDIARTQGDTEMITFLEGQL